MFVWFPQILRKERVIEKASQTIAFRGFKIKTKEQMLVQGCKSALTQLITISLIFKWA